MGWWSGTPMVASRAQAHELPAVTRADFSASGELWHPRSGVELVNRGVRGYTAGELWRPCSDT
jgi:hypothetical protein